MNNVALQVAIRSSVVNIGPDEVKDLVGQENQDVLRPYLKRGIDINKIAFKNVKILILACASGTTSVVKYLLDNGANPRTVDAAGNSLLHNVIVSKCTTTAELLIRAGCQVNEKHKDDTYLNLAVHTGCKEMISLLLDHGADINLRTRNGLTVLQEAAIDCTADMVDFLLSKGAILNCRTANTKSVMHYALEKNKVDVMKVLVRNGYVVHNEVHDQPYLLHLAACFSSLKCFTYLLNLGYDINFKTREGNTPLHYAIQFNRIDMYLYLMKNRADLNVKNIYGESPLRVAVMQNNLYAVFVLLTYRANIKIYDYNNFIPIESALYLDKHRCVEILLTFGASLDDINLEYVSPKNQEIVRNYVIKKKLAKLKLSLSETDIIYQLSNITSENMATDHNMIVFFNSCVKEIEWMKNNIFFSDVTYYEFLHKSKKQLLKNAVEFETARKIKINSANFPNYYPIIHVSSTIAKNYITLFRTAQENFMLIDDRFPNVVIENILYFLREKELKYFIAAFERAR